MKSNLLHKILNLEHLLSLIFGASVFVFFALYYPFHLHYQEQYQLFLFTKRYFFEYLSKPGGISNYLGNFFTQFYFYSTIGALFIALFLTLLQQLFLKSIKRFGDSAIFWPLSFIPSALYFSLLCNENILLGGLIAIIIITAFNLIYINIKTTRIRIITLLISLPILYWVAGGAVVFSLLFIILWELFLKDLKTKYLLFLGFISLIVTATVPLIAGKYFLQYPMKRIWIGVEYFRFPEIFFPQIAVIGIVIGTVPYFAYAISKKIRHSLKSIVVAVQLLIIFPGSYLLLSKSTDMPKEEVMAYDFYTRMRKWEDVIALADQKTPMSPLSVTCLNLALAQQDQLGEKMFTYYQNGIQGLIPDFTRDYTIPTIAGEVYYHLGMINVSQRFAFEAMEALPDYQKSTRSLKRLTETNLINGSYPIAEKYLKLLQKTFYYKRWANNVQSQLNDENFINAHREWGWLRQCRVKDDFLFSEDERDMMLGILFTQNKQNKMAFDYLLAYCLLNKDLEHFWQYFQMGQSFYSQHIPTHFQEALLYYWTSKNTDLSKKFPFPVSAQVRDNFTNYHNIYVSNMDAKPLLQKNYSDTYWYYFHFR